MDELPDAIFERVTELSEQGNAAMEDGDYARAVMLWREALGLLPAPEKKWSAAMWLHGSIGDAQRASGDIEDGLSSFQSAAATVDGAQNPFIQYGLGISLLDMGRTEEATDPLLRAYMLAGTDIFQEDDPRYLQHLMKQGLVK